MLLIPISFVVFVVFELGWVVLSGSPVPRPEISGRQQVIGEGRPLRFAVIGDSTAVSQGGEYSRGYAVATAEYLAKTHQVTWVNVAVSGARAVHIAAKQTPKVTRFKPDIVLIAVGANDVTHLTPASSVSASLKSTISQLKQANPKVQIILTGSPDMGSVPRFPQPVRWYMGRRTVSINAAISALADGKQIVFAPIAQQTGPTFRRHPELFAADNFHANTQGWQLWTPVVITAIEQLSSEK